MSLVATNETPSADKWNQKLNFIGATAPTSTFAGQIWVDTTTDPPVVKVRNNANTAFTGGFTVVINVDEGAGTVVDNTTTETSTKSFSLVANNYARIIIETGVELRFINQAAPRTNTVRLKIGATVEAFSFETVAETRIQKWHQTLKLSAVQTAAATIDVTLQPGTAEIGLGGVARSLRVYGVM